MTVYLDSVFALNFAVNWLLLRAAARLGALQTSVNCFGSCR